MSQRLSMNDIVITKHIITFREFLLTSWNDYHNLVAGHLHEMDSDFLDDWIQANWEFLVERELLQNQGYVNSIGVSYPQPRITYPDAECTYLVLCHSKSIAGEFDINKKIKLTKDSSFIFRCFFSKVDDNLILSPPFDLIGGSFIGSGELFFFELNQIEFILHPV